MPHWGWAWGTAGLHTQAPALTDGICPGVVHAQPRVSTLSGPELTHLLYNLKTTSSSTHRRQSYGSPALFPPCTPGSSAGSCGPMTQHWPRRHGQEPGTDSLAHPSQVQEHTSLCPTGMSLPRVTSEAMCLRWQSLCWPRSQSPAASPSLTRIHRL